MVSLKVETLFDDFLASQFSLAIYEPILSKISHDPCLVSIMFPNFISVGGLTKIQTNYEPVRIQISFAKTSTDGQL